MKSLPFTSAGHNFTWDVLFGSWMFLALALFCFHRLYNSFSPFFPVRRHSYNWVYDVSLLSPWEWLITSPFIRDGKKHTGKRCWKPKFIISATHGGLFSSLSEVSWGHKRVLKSSSSRSDFSSYILLPLHPNISLLTALAINFLVFPFCLSPTHLSPGLVLLKIGRTSLQYMRFLCLYTVCKIYA